MLDFNTEKIYDPKKVEDRLYSNWMEKGYFHAKVDKSKKPFTIVIPPPNITGQLHMGHALDETQQDILIRMKRMQGYSTLWLPGTDHASIATEAKIVEALAGEGLTKDMLGREKFLERAWAWKEKYGGRIVEQLKKLGSSCDWERERFTMDEGLSKAVTEVFIRLYNKGLIYRGERIINWCPGCNTSISDTEVEHEEKEGSFWHLKYPIKETGEFIAVATTRPETMLGDTAVAVNPSDKRYRHLVGKTVILPLSGREIPVIEDEYVDMELGTGAVKITPAHDPNDFEVGLRHSLAVIKVLNDDASMNENAGAYAGLDRYEARKQVLKDLQNQGFLLKTESHIHNIGTCYRCGSVIEPMVSRQWFVKMKPLAGPALEAVKNGIVAFTPDRFEKIYFNWMENIQDWCISRQLWWGHRIPAYYCCECHEMTVGRNKPDVCSFCGGLEFEQDEDTLDTWFSSALWPFSTLGWPEATEDLDYFYPTDVLVTSYDIIFFWVARMIFSGIEHTGKAPFGNVLIHGLVRDSKGRKMSKSLGNGLDPLEVIDDYGTDALRYSLTVGNAPGNDMRFSSEKIEAGRNFTNKIWNASRFVLMNFDENPDFSDIDSNKFTTADKWILSRINTVVEEVTGALENFEFGSGLQKIYEFIWEEYCDWYIELAKPRLYDREREGRKETQYVLNMVLGKAMKLLHPFMPFISEEIYQHLPGHDESIMISEWPVPDGAQEDKEAEKAMLLLMDAIKSVRNIRAEMNVAPSKKIKILLVTDDERKASLLQNESIFFRTLAGASEINIEPDKRNVPHDAVSSAIEGVEIYIPLEELIEIDKEIDRLNKEREHLKAELARVDAKLGNEKFINKAPANIVNEEREKREKYLGMFESATQRLETMKKLKK